MDVPYSVVGFALSTWWMGLIGFIIFWLSRKLKGEYQTEELPAKMLFILALTSVSMPIVGCILGLVGIFRPIILNILNMFRKK